MPKETAKKGANGRNGTKRATGKSSREHGPDMQELRQAILEHFDVDPGEFIFLARRDCVDKNGKPDVENVIINHCSPASLVKFIPNFLRAIIANLDKETATRLRSEIIARILLMT